MLLKMKDLDYYCRILVFSFLIINIYEKGTG